MTDNKKYQQILSKSRELFWKHGFKRVSVEEICKKADVSKMTFYKFFPDKVSVAKAVFEEVVVQGQLKFRAILEANTTPAEKISAMLRLKSESTNDISREFLHDFYSSEKTELRDYINEVTQRAWVNVIADFKKAQKEGVFRKDFKPEFLFFLSQKLAESINDEKLLALFPSPHDLIVELASLMCYGIAPRNKK